jgi:hypothetical protein
MVVAVIALITAAACTPAPAPPCSSWAGGDTASLQAAVNANSCVTVPPGTWHLNNHIALPAGHTLTGQTGMANVTTLVADPSPAWGCCTGMVDVNPRNSQATPNAAIRHLTLQAAHTAVIGIGGGLFDVSDVAVNSTVCNGLSVYGPRVTVDSSRFSDNGLGASCPRAPPGAAIYIHNVPGDPMGPPTITNNSFTRNGSPIDLDSVDGGRVVKNTFTNNDGWAAVALYRGSFWTVTDNVINHPQTAILGNNPGGNFSYQRGCQFGPLGGHPAAIWLCENFNTDGHFADHNTIARNTLSSYYAIEFMGLDDPQEGGRRTVAPRFNTTTDNRVTAGVLGLIDDYEPHQPAGGDNVWARNSCPGHPCLPHYF